MGILPLDLLSRDGVVITEDALAKMFDLGLLACNA
jgi:hypothetical protein